MSGWCIYDAVSAGLLKAPAYKYRMFSFRRTLLCCAVLCCAVLCCAVLCCAVLCCVVLCCAVHIYILFSASMYRLYTERFIQFILKSYSSFQSGYYAENRTNVATENRTEGIRVQCRPRSACLCGLTLRRSGLFTPRTPHVICMTARSTGNSRYEFWWRTILNTSSISRIDFHSYLIKYSPQCERMLGKQFYNVITNIFWGIVIGEMLIYIRKKSCT
jgi:hypothetical protein